jgi:hypothetical protein
MKFIGKQRTAGSVDVVIAGRMSRALRAARRAPALNAAKAHQAGQRLNQGGWRSGVMGCLRWRPHDWRRRVLRPAPTSSSPL